MQAHQHIATHAGGKASQSLSRDHLLVYGVDTHSDEGFDCSESHTASSSYGCFRKWWYPTTMGFPTKNDHFGVFWRYHHLRKHPYISRFRLGFSRSPRFPLIKSGFLHASILLVPDHGTETWRSIRFKIVGG